MVQLGDKVTDSITGFSGVAVVRAEYLDKHVRVCVESTELKDGKPVAEWFDEERLKAQS